MSRYTQAPGESRDWSGNWTTERTTTWIPEQYAHLNNYIKLKKDDGTWEDGWKVIEVGTRLSEEYVLDHERDYKTQRKASDI